MDWNSNRSLSSKIKNESGEKLALYQLLESDMLYLKFLFTNLCILQSNGHLVYFWGCITVHTKKGMDTWVWGKKDCGFSSLSRNNTPKNGRKWENTWVVVAHYNVVVVVLMTKGRRCYLAYSTLLHWSLLWCPQEYGLYNIKVCNPSLLLLICPHHSNYEEWGLAMTT